MGEENGDYVSRLTSRDHLTTVLEINPIEIEIKRIFGERTGRLLERIDGIYKFSSGQATRPKRRKFDFF